MKVTGYKLQHAIRDATQMLGVISSQWDDSLHAFAGENKTSPSCS